MTGPYMSDLAQQSGSHAFDEAHADQLRRVAASVYWVVVVAGVALTTVAVPLAVVFMASAEAEFWILVALALSADIRPVRLPPLVRRSTTFVVSVCFCFVILLLYGVGPAIVVQVVAVAVTARRLRLNWRSWSYLTARLVCSFAAAGVAARLLGLSRSEIHSALGIAGVLELATVAAVFVAVSCAINVAGALSSRATRSEVATQLRFELIARGSVLVLGAIIATTPSAWSLLLLFVPIIGWSQLARALADQDRRLEVDARTGLLSRHGVAVAMLEFPREHSRETDWFVLTLIQLRGLAYVSRNFGQEVVESLLTEVAGHLRDVARPGDLIGRMSESQFVIVSSDFAVESAIDGARRIVRSLSDPMESAEGIPFRLDPVAGVAAAPQHGYDLGQLIPHAEAALFDATVHRNAATLYTPAAQSDVDDRLAVLGRLSAAVNDPDRASEIAVLFSRRSLSRRAGVTQLRPCSVGMIPIVAWCQPMS